MKNYKIVIIIGLIIMIIVGIFIDTYSLEKRQKSKSYQAYVKAQNDKLVSNYLENQINKSSSNNEIDARREGTTGNFEGPQVLFEYLKFHDKLFNKEGNQMLYFDGNTLNFDPDHPSFGLPNLVAKISPVSTYNHEVSGLVSLLHLSGGEEKQKPYRIYHKTIVTKNATDSILREFEMQLWLTEFKVTVAIEPERKKPIIPPTSKENDQIQYPGYWYGSTQDYIKLGDLKPEWKNNRYSDLKLIFKIIPNNAPWYYKTKYEKNARPGIGIGAIYCESINVTREGDESRISPNIQKGSVIFLHSYYNPQNDSIGITHNSENLGAAAGKIFDEQSERIDSTSSFWNKSYYMRIFFNNIGSWKESLFGARKYDDQITFSFLMPIFVIGSWDIIPPKEIIPEWNPPKPYFKDFFSNLIPSFGLKGIGKFLSIIGWVAVIVTVLPLIIPSIPNIIKKIFKG